MKYLALVLAFSVPAAALAQLQNRPDEPGYTAPIPPGSQERTRPLGPGRSFSGLVEGIDKATGTVTLRHGPIDMLGVRAGTSEYEVKDASLLQRLKVGDRVEFNAVLQGRSLQVTHIAPPD